jgi:hypothetical protein
MIDDVKNFVAFVKVAPTHELIITGLFVLVILCALLFQWLWLRERNHCLRLENKDNTPRADDTAIATFSKVKRLAPREPLGKLALKASKIAPWILPSTHHTKIPEAKDIKNDISGKHTTTNRCSQSQVTRR